MDSNFQNNADFSGMSYVLSELASFKRRYQLLSNVCL